MKYFGKIIVAIFICFSGKANGQNIDLAILKGINPQNPSSSVWRAASGTVDWTAGAVSFGTLAYGLIKKDKNIQYNGYELFIAMGFNIATTQFLKYAVNRTRPGDQYPTEVSPVSVSHDKSFPSGHTSQAFAVATTLTLQYPKWYVAVPAYTWAACVGYSRIYLGKHYPSDVLAGAVIGAGSSYLSHMLSKRLFRHQKAKPGTTK